MSKFTRQRVLRPAKSGSIFTVQVCVLALALVSGVGFAQPSKAAGPTVTPMDAAGYQSTVFVQGTSAATKPDSVVVANGNVYVGYQNNTAADGTDGGSSTIISYSATNGTQLNSWSVKGRCDGLRLNPYTNLLWALVNEDGNSSLFTINPTTGAIVQYQWSSAAHGGGYDDAAFVNGMAFVTASAPNTDTNGNVFPGTPAVVSVVLQGTTAQVTPVLTGNATALDTTTNMQITLNLVDPDSLSVDSQGNIILVNQAGSEIISLQSPGTPSQKVTRLPVPTQLDDTLMIPPAIGSVSPSTGKLFVVDGSTNTIYTVTAPFTAGKIYTETPNDSSVPGIVGIVDPATGNLTPVVAGYTKPTGLVFATQFDLTRPVGGALTPPGAQPAGHAASDAASTTPAPQPTAHPVVATSSPQPAANITPKQASASNPQPAPTTLPTVPPTPAPQPARH